MQYVGICIQSCIFIYDTYQQAPLKKLMYVFMSKEGLGTETRPKNLTQTVIPPRSQASVPEPSVGILHQYNGPFLL